MNGTVPIAPATGTLSKWLHAAPKEARGAKRNKSGQSQVTDENVLGKKIDFMIQVLAQHDVSLRTIECATVQTFMIPTSAHVSKVLLDAMIRWTSEKPQQGPHPLGPPRCLLFGALCALIQQALAEAQAAGADAGPQLYADATQPILGQWLQLLTPYLTETSIRQVDQHVNTLTCRKAKTRDITLVRFGLKVHAHRIFHDGIPFIHTILSGPAAEWSASSLAPEGPLIRRLKGRGRQKEDMDLDDE